LADETYLVRFTASAEKDLDSNACKPHIKEILETVKKLETDPSIGKPLKQSLSGVRSIHLNIKGRGQWRIAYTILGNICLIVAIGPRGNFYDTVKHRYGSIKLYLN